MAATHSIETPCTEHTQTLLPLLLHIISYIKVFYNVISELRYTILHIHSTNAPVQGLHQILLYQLFMILEET